MRGCVRKSLCSSLVSRPPSPMAEQQRAATSTGSHAGELAAPLPLVIWKRRSSSADCR
ncbi:unnamed protein product [Lampetra fluviatilis]